MAGYINNEQLRARENEQTCCDILDNEDTLMSHKDEKWARAISQVKWMVDNNLLDDKTQQEINKQNKTEEVELEVSDWFAERERERVKEQQLLSWSWNVPSRLQNNRLNIIQINSSILPSNRVLEQNRVIIQSMVGQSSPGEQQNGV